MVVLDSSPGPEQTRVAGEYRGFQIACQTILVPYAKSTTANNH